MGLMLSLAVWYYIRYNHVTFNITIIGVRTNIANIAYFEK